MKTSQQSSFDYYSSDEEDELPPPPPPFDEYEDSPAEADAEGVNPGGSVQSNNQNQRDMPVNGYYRGLQNAQNFEEEEAGMDEIEVPSSSVVARMNDDEHHLTSRQRRNRKFMYGAFALFGIGAAVAISLGTVGAVRGKGANKSVTEDIPTTDTDTPPVDDGVAEPTLAPTPWLSGIEESDDPLLNKMPSKFLRSSPLLPAGTSTALIDNTSPQYQALKWTMEDAANVEMNFQDVNLLQTRPDVQEQLVQRFAAGTLYFAMHADDEEKWETDTNWMSEKSVCDWHGITCGDGIDEAETRQGTRTRNLEALTGRETITKLDLKENNLHGQIPPELFMFPELTSIELYGNWMSGILPDELFALPKLEVLDIDDNLLTGAIPASISSLTNMKMLYLSKNRFTGPIPPEIGELSNLEELWLGDDLGNTFSGGIPAEFGNLANLKEFRCIDCGLGGPLPAEIGNLASIDVMMISDNGFTSLPAEMSNLKTLQVLTLSNNPISTGPFPEALFGLEALQTLTLKNTGLKAAFPAEFSSLKNLRTLRINNNEISGVIPEGVMSEWTQMQRISFEGNKITGLPTDMNKMEDLLFCDIFENEIAGDIPDLPLKLIQFQAFKNKLVSLPGNLDNLPSMKIFDVGNNLIEGELPTSIGSLGTGTERKLEELYLNKNKFEGPLPEEIGDLQGLKRLELSENEFDGDPEAIGNLINLEVLEMDNNNFGSDELPIPESFGNLVKLERLLLNVNNFIEAIPTQIGNLVQLEELNLSQNFISGALPEEISKLVNLRKLNLGLNLLRGEIPDMFTGMEDLRELSLNENKFDRNPGFWGGVPDSIYGLEKLEILRLHGNILSEPISEKFADLERLEILNLKDNEWDIGEDGGVPLLICQELTELVKFEVGCDYEGDCECCTDEC